MGFGNFVGIFRPVKRVRFNVNTNYFFDALNNKKTTKKKKKTLVQANNLFDVGRWRFLIGLGRVRSFYRKPKIQSSRTVAVRFWRYYEWLISKAIAVSVTRNLFCFCVVIKWRSRDNAYRASSDVCARDERNRYLNYAEGKPRYFRSVAAI